MMGKDKDEQIAIAVSALREILTLRPATIFMDGPGFHEIRTANLISEAQHIVIKALYEMGYPAIGERDK